MKKIKKLGVLVLPLVVVSCVLMGVKQNAYSLVAPGTDCWSNNIQSILFNAILQSYRGGNTRQKIAGITVNAADLYAKIKWGFFEKDLFKNLTADQKKQILALIVGAGYKDLNAWPADDGTYPDNQPYGGYDGTSLWKYIATTQLLQLEANLIRYQGEIKNNLDKDPTFYCKPEGISHLNGILHEFVDFVETIMAYVLLLENKTKAVDAAYNKALILIQSWGKQIPPNTTSVAPTPPIDINAILTRIDRALDALVNMPLLRTQTSNSGGTISK